MGYKNIAQQVKVFPIGPDTMSFIPKTHRVEGKN